LKCQHLWEEIKNDADGLGELAKTPLFLNLIPVAYPNGLVSKGKRFNSEDERKEYQEKCRKELFDKYVERRLREHHDRKGYKAEDVKRWLVWLAKTMKEHKLKEFYIEKMQPSYLDNRKQRILYSLIYGLIIGLIYGLIYGLIMGLIYWLIYWLICGLTVGLTSFFQPNIKTVENLKIGFNFKWFLIIVLMIRLFLEPKNRLAVGLFFGLLVGLSFGFKRSELINKTNANQGIKESIKNAFIFALIALSLLILFGFSLSDVEGVSLNTFNLILVGLGSSLFMGISFAGTPVIQHISLRLILWKNRSIPWNYARFLKYADERKLIDQVGGRFTFIHDKLQEHFARM
jgi:hypothetical protein